MSKMKRCRCIALLLTAVVALVPVKVQAATPPAAAGVTQTTFDAQRYADTYPDLKKAFGYNEALLWQHYQQFGIKEGRQVFAKGATPAPAATTGGLTAATFDARRYADTYADIKKAFGYNEALLWQHYQQYGIKEGRQAFVKGATAPAAGTVTAVPTPAPADSSTFLTKEGGSQIADYVASMGAMTHKNQLLILRDPGGGWSLSFSPPKGWKATQIVYTLWDGNDYWSCGAWDMKNYVPPIAQAKARTLAEAQAFLNRFKP